MKNKWKLLFGISLFNDLLDLAGIGSIPIIGDIIDLASSAVLWRSLGTRPVIPTLLEFIPGLDLLPIYTATVAWAYYKEEDGEGMEEVEIRSP